MSTADVAALPPAAPQGRPAPLGPGRPSRRFRRRVELSLVCLGLVLVAFRQGGGRQLPDTKLDLVEDPAAWLTAALSLWDAGAGLGQTQNQAYGYLFPMGPFFWLGDVLQLPPWAVQRSWWALLLVVAFLGLVRLCRVLGMGTAWTQVLGGLLYALSPRIMSELGTISVESWPVALAPWAVVPLVRPAGRWRAAGTSAVAVLLMGGVNAAATAAAVVPAAVWLLTRRPDRAAAGLLWRWVAAVLAATAWWWGPLLLLGRYSPPFLDWIEDAGVTTRAASPYEALRGTTHWIAYLADPDGPVWPVGWSLVTEPVLVVNTAVVSLVGLVGVVVAPSRHRVFLGGLLLLGVTALTAGHVGAGAPAWAGAVHGGLDGALAPLRNTHKFDALTRLALCVGVVHAVAGAHRGARRLEPGRSRVPRAVAVVAAIGCLGAAAPAAAGALAPRGGFQEIPAYWRDAATWLDASAAPGAVLVLPGAGAAQFTWGTTADEPLQALMRRPVVVRDAVPLGGAGATRLLDGWQRQLEVGQGHGVAGSLRRAGIGFVVLRADLAPSTGAPPPLVLREGLVRAGLSGVARFGPPAGSPVESAVQTLDDRLLQAVPSVEVFRVPGGGAAAHLYPVRGAVRATGGPEDITRLVASGVADDRAVLLGPDAEAVPDPDPVTVLTDGLRKRETFYGRSRDQQSQTLTAADPGLLDRRAREPLVLPAPELATTARYLGIRDVRTSSSAADAGATLRLGPGASGWAAVDGDLRTRWVSGTYGSAVGEWIQLDLLGPVEARALTLRTSSSSPVGAAPTRVRVDTDAGSLTTGLAPGDGAQSVPLPSGPARWVRLTLERTGPGTENAFGITEIAVPGVAPRRTLVLPAPGVLGAGDPVDAVDGVLLEGAPGADGCVLVGTRPICSPRLPRVSEDAAGLDRTLASGGLRAADVSGTAHALAGPELDRLLDAGEPTRVSASSSWTTSAASRPGTLVDRDLGTGWTASAEDLVPRLVITLPEQRRVSGLQVLVDGAHAASRPTALRVDTGAGAHDVRVDEQGYATFPAARTARVVVDIVRWQQLRSTDTSSGAAAAVPPGISELRLLGADDLRRARPAEDRIVLPCGQGPELGVGSTRIDTEVSGTYGDVMADRALDWRPCDEVALPAGDVRVVAPATPTARPATLVLLGNRAGAPAARARRPVALGTTRAGAVPDAVRLGRRDQGTLLALTQNHNAGWRARLDGAPLRPVRVDGWRQGWVVPAGPAGEVEVTFAPQRAYAAALGGGGALASSLVLLVVLGRRSGRHAPAPPVRPMPPGRGPAAAAVALVVAATGATGLLAVAGVAVLLLLRGRAGPRWLRGRAALPAVVGGAWTAASALVLTSLWPQRPAAVEDPVVQVLVALALAGVAAGAVTGRPRSATGRSTSV